ncbi:GntR family transcriptional regulator [Pigmentiphaga litoralis]|uniref:DNA-binding GntR family transcriptional regulator n=1 Tax=Pigmentiphaga litoralis TaxID=516702 RepID=A0A7Y9IVB0_9BURK|nr:FCD domain-containing protein [Pigmentiphaga litoralis]NYE23492.1 DNA-binding GntR family transcriptional regulator [Pigmentiphaga litoralis]NYE82894.1 DNA-binding GntR family transcriptional regulator [Pigmentiphaga litoralis]
MPEISAALPPLAHAAAPTTLVGSAYASLRRDIIEGRLPPGSRLRVEHLKDSYGVGAGTLREALALLVSDALVIVHGQRGFHVTPISLEDFLDITRNRMLMESEALRQSIAVGDDVWESRVIAAFHRLRRAEERLAVDRPGRFNEWEERNREFHQALISACDSRWMHHFLGILYQQAERYRRLTIVRDPIPRDLHDEHQGILDATLARDAELASRLLRDHIGTTYEAVKHLPAHLFDGSTPASLVPATLHETPAGYGDTPGQAGAQAPTAAGSAHPIDADLTEDR